MTLLHFQAYLKHRIFWYKLLFSINALCKRRLLHFSGHMFDAPARPAGHVSGHVVLELLNIKKTKQNKDNIF